ncbi:unnamed protein product [Linum trigynum]|uniref:CCHC-type domain-containing protein n=1 Tax=Linum trigynum TaxID=586398 RepID=A0AAV2CTJ1_9ROSI
MRLRSQAKLDLHASDSGVVFAVQSGWPQFGRTPSGEIICYHCKEPGHVQVRCPKRIICNYCKTQGHVIGDCSILARRGRARGGSDARPSSHGDSNSGANFRHVAGRGSSGGAFAATYAPPMVTSSSATVSSSGVSSEEIRRLIREAL